MAKKELPDNWCTIVLPDLVDLINGATPKGLPLEKSIGTIPFIKISDMNSPDNQKAITSSKIMLEECDVKKFNLKLVPRNAVIFPKNGGALLTNKKRYTTKQSAIDTNIMAAVPPVQIFSYFWHWFQTVDFKEYASGSTVPMVSFSDIKGIKVPVPPVGEQKRIVEMIESTQEKIQKIEECVNKAEKLAIKYREALLQKAFRGELVPQDTKDDPASKVIQKIHEESKSWASSKNSKLHSYTPVPQDEAPYEIPISWQWERLGNLVKPGRIITYGIVQAGPHVDNGVPYIRVTDMVGSELSPAFMKRTSPEIAAKFERSAVIENDIVYALRGRIGDVMKVPKLLTGANLTQGTARVSPSAHIDVDYLLYALQTENLRKQANKKAKGSTFKEITLESLRNLMVPIAPYPEQIRIKNQLLQSLGKIDGIAAKIALSAEGAHQTGQSVLKSAFAGMLVEQIDSEGTGKDLLAQLKLAKGISETHTPIAKTVKKVKK